MTQHLESTNRRRVRPIGWAVLLAFVIGSSYMPVAAGERLDEARSSCHGDDSTFAGVHFEPITHDISTSAPLGSDSAEVRWVLSSEVTISGDSASEGIRYCYAYLFRNVGSTPVKVSLVSPRLALSPLFEIMQDFSLVLYPGATEMIRFSTVSAPELALATAYNAARGEKIAKWAFVSSGPISLYLPAATRASFAVPD